MKFHKFSKNKPKSAKQERKEIQSTWDFITTGRRSFGIYKGNRPFSFKEDVIQDLLKAMKITFYREVSFDMKRRYDFFLPKFDTIIEYDGWQHYELKSFEKDREKEIVLQKMGIKLIRYNRSTDLVKQIQIDFCKLKPPPTTYHNIERRF